MEESESYRRSSESDDGRSPDDDYQLTHDQRAAMMELDNRSAETVYPDEEPPEYDVTDRLRQLNAELKEEDDPSEDRETRVGFNDDPVSMVVPPPQFSDDEESGRDSARVSESDTQNEQQTDKPNESESEQRHLVEKDGKFEYISNEEYMAQERREEEEKQQQTRPHTAGGTDSKKEQGQPRAQSAGSGSRYGMSAEQRRLVSERKKSEQKRREDEEKKRREEEDERRRENDEAFKAWLKQKREQQKEENRQARARGEQQQEEEDRDPAKAYKEWCRLKSKRQQEEKDMESKRMAEVQDGYFVRSRKECDKAFREWVKRKNAEKKQQTAQQRQRMYAMSARRSRKSQALAQAIQYSQAFRDDGSLMAIYT